MSLFHMLDAMGRQRAEEDIRDGLRALWKDYRYDLMDVDDLLVRVCEEVGIEIRLQFINRIEDEDED